MLEATEDRIKLKPFPLASQCKVKMNKEQRQKSHYEEYQYMTQAANK